MTSGTDDDTGTQCYGEGSMKNANKTYSCFCSNRFCCYYGQPMNLNNSRCTINGWVSHYLAGR